MRRIEKDAGVSRLLFFNPLLQDFFYILKKEIKQLDQKDGFSRAPQVIKMCFTGRRSIASLYQGVVLIIIKQSANARFEKRQDVGILLVMADGRSLVKSASVVCMVFLLSCSITER